MKNANRALKFFKLLLIVVSIFYIGMYVFIAVSRMAYPFQLEALEGQSLVEIKRIIAGEQFYTMPSLEYVALPYTPLYFYLSAFLAKIIGVTFLPLRLLSFIASLGCFFLIFLIVKRETKSNLPGITAAGMFAAMFKIAGAWYDIGRVDSLFIFFLLVGLYFLKFGATWRSQVIAGIFTALSFMTKQTMAVISVPLMLYAFIAHRKRSVFFIGTFASLAGASMLVINYINQGWFFYYFFSAGRHFILKNVYVDFWTKDLFAPLPVACVLIVYYLCTKWKGLLSNFYFLAAIGMLAGAYVSRIDVGGYSNVLFPAYLCVAILLGVSFYSIDKDSGRLGKIALYCLLLVQFALLAYNPLYFIPTKKDAQMGVQLVDTISGFGGDVFIPHHNYVLAMAGKKVHAHGISIWEILSFKREDLRKKMQNELETAILEKKFSAIMLDNHMLGLGWLPDTVKKSYVRQGPVFSDEKGFFTVSGVPIRPQDIYVPANSTVE